jgi:pyruvate formate lyase activating enzyme
MHEAVLYDKLTGSYVQHHGCQWRCKMAPGKYGVCRMYQNREGILYNLNYGLTSSVNVDPIEKKPLFHACPGSQVFSLGGWGCNFHCEHCQNWGISCVNFDEIRQGSQEISPELSVELAKEYRCRGIAWTYNEPTMWFEYTLDAARLAKAQGLYTVYVTNGYMTPEALDMIAPYLTAWRVDVKGFSDAFWRKLAGLPRWRGILEVARRAKDRWGLHVEVVTNIIPAMNDDDAQLEGIARWIASDLGELTPWHLTRFYPQYKMSDQPPTPTTTMQHARDIGRAAGLKFIYLGNMPGGGGEDTVCYNCHNLVVERTGYQVEVLNLNGSRCGICGAELNFRSCPDIYGNDDANNIEGGHD